MVVLYHFGGAICAQKVRIALAEKGVSFESRLRSGPGLRDPDYLELNPNGVVPTLIHNNAVLSESRIISEYIEEAFEGPALMPADALGRYQSRHWSKQIDDSLHLNIFILTFATTAREIFRQMLPETRAAAIPGLRDPIKRQIANELLEQGVNTTWARMAVDRFRRLMTDMEKQLSKFHYMAGSAYSLSDCDYTAYFHRLEELGLNELWVGKAAVQDWWGRVQERPSYREAISDWDTPEDARRYRNARDTYGDELRPLLLG